MITEFVPIRHAVGRCPICGAPILDVGWTDDPYGWTHALPIFHPTMNAFQNAPMINYCAMNLSR